jgi:hypothetical protein
MNHLPSDPTFHRSHASKSAEGKGTLHFYESLPGTTLLHATRLLKKNGEWMTTTFVHRTPADLLESISTQQLTGGSQFRFRPTEYPVYECDELPVAGLVGEYAYHRIIWGSDGKVRGYGETEFRTTPKAAFYAVKRDHLEIRISMTDYNGTWIYANLTTDLTLAIQPQLLSAFLRNFLNGGKGTTSAMSILAPSLSSFYISLGDQDYCLCPDLNAKLHEYPWLSVKPQAPRPSLKNVLRQAETA